MAPLIDPTTLKERLRESAQVLRSRAESIEREGSVPADLIEELKAGGLFRAFVPKRYGGWEAEFFPVLESLSFLGEACASTCWVASLFASHSLLTAWFPEGAQNEVWGEEPDALVGSSLAPVGRMSEVDGGYRLSGDWSYSSGIDHAGWLLLGAKDEEEQSRLVLVPAVEASVQDDWRVCGLEGTGSKSVSLKDCFIPTERTLKMSELESGATPGHAVNPGGVFRFPWRAAFSFSFVPTALGVARAALSASQSYLNGKCSAYTGKRFAESQVGLAHLAQSAGELDAAWALTKLCVTEIDSLLRTQSPVPASLVAQASYAPAQVVVLCRRSVERLFRKSGAGALRREAPLQRYLRDIQAVGQHPGVNIDIAGPMYGKALLENPDWRVGE